MSRVITSPQRLDMGGNQDRRSRHSTWFLIAMAVALFGAVGLFAVMPLRTQRSSHESRALPEAEIESGDPTLSPFPADAFDDLLLFARGIVDGAPEDPAAVELPTGADVPIADPLVVLSLTREKASALVVRGFGSNVTEAVAMACEELLSHAKQDDVANGRLKLDVAVQLEKLERIDSDGCADLDPSLHGLWLAEHGLLFLPEELTSRRLVNSDNDPQTPRIHGYLAEGGQRPIIDLSGNPAPVGANYQRIVFHSVMEGPDGRPAPLYRGNPLEQDVTPERLLEAVRQGGDYLLRHLRPDGDFGYNYDPRTDVYDDQYNLLRHAGTCYALAELQQTFDEVSPGESDRPYVEGARRGLERLLAEHVQGPRPEDADADFEAVVSPGNEAKLGGAALAVLAMLRYEEVTGDDQFRPRVRKLAKHLLFQQEPNGHFFGKYHYDDVEAEPFESIYYPGEAILSLARLAKVEPDGPWLDASRRGADWLIDVRDAGKSVAELPHDHWLLMALDELDQLTGDERYAAHAAKIAEAIVEAQRLKAPYPDWVGTFYTPPRSTPTATRGEALVAMERLARRTGRDPQPYRDALLRMAAFQMRCQITPENALYLPKPDRALGGFRRGLTDWEVRIDYVQHNVSALLGLRSLMLQGD